MQVTRMDLDGTGSPMGLVGKILKAEPALTLPVPIEQLAHQLDIAEIRDLFADGFEGGLITDDARSSGFILVNHAARRGRRRFTIGHELGHFLMTTHKPPAGGFQCSRTDMRRWTDKEKGGAIRMEVEANEFAALILMPPPLWRAELAKFREPDLAQIVTLAGLFDVSKEAAARAYAQYSEEPVAVVVAKDGKIDKVYRDIARFPRLGVTTGAPMPANSLLFRAGRELNYPSSIAEARAEAWLESDWGKPPPGLYEQVFFQQNGFALIMLWAKLADEEEDDGWGEKTAKQRLQDRLAR
ncbi:ImmA/IrrE family metallo-endopeptidase [Methylocapsa sp. D3K7]|uniref:ImmA/IrrE family metallo-endopeptidase n=1 Tax=Methylocapsa sp. D3K7 TaxID=3041435 RepID=UPI00244EEC01|nr:ImmA/IrrE family metallo-endopeptidase [Methylocapsa sp. D3K7]WGJ15971.1 ImmA/IrrE family metallo-endopeptidase [Methylocapsa sp. D3K7]